MYDSGSLINCFSLVFLTHQLTGTMGHEVEMLKPLARNFVEQGFGYSSEIQYLARICEQ